MTSVSPGMRSPSCEVAILLVARAYALVRQVLDDDRFERGGLEAEYFREGARAHVVHAHRAQVVARDELARKVLEDERLQRGERAGKANDAAAAVQRPRDEAHQLLERIDARSAKVVGSAEPPRAPQPGHETAPHARHPHTLKAGRR